MKENFSKTKYDSEIKKIKNPVISIPKNTRHSELVSESASSGFQIAKISNLSILNRKIPDSDIFRFKTI